jgi:hypothetical protein
MVQFYRRRVGTLCAACFPAKRRAIQHKINPYKRLVGVEIEFISEARSSTLAEAMVSLGRIKGDGSVMPRNGQYGSGHEFASYVTEGDDLMDLLKRATRNLQEYGAVVNQTCGLHVHLDMQESTDPQKTNIVSWWNAFEKVFFALVSPSRRGNRYCQAGATTPARASDRYKALNTAAFSEHGTYEIRLHHGTVMTGTIQRWCLFLLQFFDVFKDIPFTPTERQKLAAMDARQVLIYLMQKMNLKLKHRKYLVRKIRRHDRAYRPVKPVPFFDIRKKKKAASQAF